MSHPLSSSGQWKAFDKEPKDQPSMEDAVFKPMAEIFKRVVGVVIASSRSNPTVYAARPDPHMLVKDRPGRVNTYWADVVLLDEYKQKDEIEELDNASTLCKL
ncbi:hypothetical protein BS47DRAFT_1391598 [Hydnum rufescens UP504]|uniref:Uncharacterized protein n=1 Tax=Hydnum rufescens UP504 TaxID=1448309 RepID=A0A9P6DVK2_9AGAM|nr:hypothetical protein BS47DRAFT_1391598 [Hydnum rufescens UP504]